MSGRAVFEFFVSHLSRRPRAMLVVSAESEAPDYIAQAATNPNLNLRYLSSDDFLKADLSDSFELCIMSPGIAPFTPLYQKAADLSSELISEPELAYRAYERDWIAVTGTNGKTTTTALIAHLLQESGRKAVAVGNIGNPAITDAQADAVVVAELSSFQLDAIKNLRARVSGILNLSPDHLNWDADIDGYYAAKMRIFENSAEGDLVILNEDDAIPATILKDLQARGADIRWLSMARASQEIRRWVSPEELQIKGTHNHFNAQFAAEAAAAYGLSDEEISVALKTFKPVAHRLEYVDTVAGVTYFNDSKATNPEASMAALDAFNEQGFHLLIGGKNKGNSFKALLRKALAKDNLSSIIFFGAAGPEAAAEFEELYSEGGRQVKHRLVFWLADAFAYAADIAQPGESVVLSPACASFDEFNSYEHRGDYFADLVRQAAR